MKDNFSGHAQQYALHRPHLPQEVFEYLYSLCGSFSLAWDIGTGNGQVASVLSQRFAQVIGTDISQRQMDHAPALPHVEYRLEPAESPTLPPQSVDLAVAAQAAHWFDFDRFYPALCQVLKPGGIFAAIGYGLITPPPAAVAPLHALYFETLRPHWDPERHHIDEEYRSLPFPLMEIPAPRFSLSLQWSLHQFMAYLETWSAVQHYRKTTGSDPLAGMKERFQSAWPGDDAQEVSFPVFVRVGRCG